MDKIDLYDCPFCGSQKRKPQIYDTQVYCQDCGARTAHYSSVTFAVAMWNKRSELAALRAERDSWRRVLEGMTSERDAALARAERYELLRFAVNESANNCDEAGCDSNGHAPGCKTYDAAAMLEQAQARVKELEAQHESECASHNDTRRTLDACRDDRDRYQDLAASMRARAEAAERERDALMRNLDKLKDAVAVVLTLNSEKMHDYLGTHTGNAWEGWGKYHLIHMVLSAALKDTD